MKRFHVIAVAGLFTLGIAAQAQAAGEEERSWGEKLEGAAETTGETLKGGAEYVGEALGLTEEEQAEYEGAKRAEHRMTGTITDIDRTEGIVTLESGERELKLHFPSDSIGTLREGETVTVQLAYANIQQRERSREQARDVPEPGEWKGEHWITGRVEDVDHEKGIVELEAGEESLKLHFPPDQIRDLRSGDRIAVQLAFARAARAETQEEIERQEQ